VTDRSLRKVLATWHATEAELAAIRAAVGEAVELATPDPPSGLSRYECSLAAIARHLGDSDAIIGWVLPEGALERASSLQLLCWLHAGIDELDQAELARREVKVCNVRGANAIAVAEHAVALLLALAKRLPAKHAAVREGRAVPLWDPAWQGSMLAGRTVTIVGLGNIGGGVAQRLSGFGMHVVGIRRDPSKENRHVDAVRGPDGLLDALGASDFVVLAVPITPATEGMFGERELAALKPGSLLVNVARGNLVDERALGEALSNGTLRGYASDVWWNYTNSFPATYHFPTPSRTGVHLLDSVLGSGDQANNAEGVRERDIEFGLTSLRQFLNGEPLNLEVDLARGY
jgi:phosphoglycerate dehydrogenase-like enzyme